MNRIFRKKSIDRILEQVKQEGSDSEHHALNKVLTVRDLTALGIAAIIGAGIFSTVGSACFDGGPGVIFLFMISAVACGFSALCYAEFASRIPVSGSAYTYSYAVFGELVAWIIGWDLLMEYAIGNITVAISWSSNFTSFLNNLGLHLPDYLSTGFLTVYNAHKEISNGINPVPEHLIPLETIWKTAPRVLNIPLILNIPALMITIFITWLVYIGIRESRNSTNLMVVFKVVVILVIILIGFFYINPDNWIPFMPNGFSGVMKGVSAVFFAYMGFDAISTTAEECKNPRKDLPRAMFYSLIICTVLYILIALVLTGMVPYYKLNVGDFLAAAFNERGMHWLGGLIAFSAIIATASVLLVFQMGQPRIWMSMSRDGLLPKKFSRIHRKYKTPSFSTILTGFVVGVPALIMDSDFVTDLCSIGTLFAFFLVCGGMLLLPKEEEREAKFKVPFISSRIWLPLISLSAVILCIANWDTIYPYLTVFSSESGNFHRENLPYLIFVIFAIFMMLRAILKNYSLIPVLGLLSCAYLITELGITNWIRFSVWLVLGIIVYFTYSIKNSKLNKA